LEEIINKNNELRFEKSPYLLQHANNPVNWLPWGDKAFKIAHREDKPVFLSIGYSTCHWCHIMEKESFEDRAVAELLNRVFINIKVDREERPDIDKIYMSVAQMLTGRGGWPLTIIMTPQKEPFFAGTYIPRESRLNMVGMLELIPEVAKLWRSEREEILRSASDISKKLKGLSGDLKKAALDYSILDKAFNDLYRTYDRKYGGFGLSPKFPSAHNLSFLSSYWNRTKNSDSLEVVENTLKNMRMGGIWDHIGSGFHRYSTDREWLVPHFEKMLYDQAISSFAYLDAFQITGKKEYGKTVESIFDYVLGPMRSKEGGFYSAEDADSEGEEGTFYLWTQKEIKSILTDDEAAIIIRVFDILEDGNFREESTGAKTGKNILFTSSSFEDLAADFNIKPDVFTIKIDGLLKKINSVREKRIHPFKDDKILTDWNGLMIAALARGGRVLDEPGFLEHSENAMNFILNTMSAPDGGLYHRYRDGKASITANLDDYAFIIMALLELYQSTFKAGYIEKALLLDKYLDKHFWDEENGGYYFTSDLAEKLIDRQKESFDGAIPSGNSTTMLNLIKLGRITMDSRLEQKAISTGEAFSESINNSPASHSQFLIALDFLSGPSYEIIIIGGKSEKKSWELIRTLEKYFIPNKVVVYRSGKEDLKSIGKISKFINTLKPIDDKATVYICKNYFCELPTTDKEEMLRLLNIKK